MFDGITFDGTTIGFETYCIDVKHTFASSIETTE